MASLNRRVHLVGNATRQYKGRSTEIGAVSFCCKQSERIFFSLHFEISFFVQQQQQTKTSPRFNKTCTAVCVHGAMADSLETPETQAKIDHISQLMQDAVRRRLSCLIPHSTNLERPREGAHLKS
jgi:hypothetical protein